MSYIGNTPAQQAFTPQVDYFNGTGSQTAFTLSRPVASVAQIEVTVNNVAQNPGTAYTVNGNTITFTGAPSVGTNNVYVRYTSLITQVIQPGQGTVGSSQMATGAAVANIGYTPFNKAGDTMTGLLDLGAVGQVKFPAAQNASSDANTLDDYEEGTWTPVFDSDVAGSGRVTTVTHAKYTKIGRVVHVQFFAQITVLGSGGSGVWVINGLPFTSVDASDLVVGSVYALASSQIAIGGITNGTRFVMRNQAAAGTALLNNATFSSVVTGGTYVEASCTYITNT